MSDSDDAPGPVAGSVSTSVDLTVTLTLDVSPARYLASEEAVKLSGAIREAVVLAAGSRGFTRGSIGVLVTDDDAIHEINRRHLAHDHATDVISFAYFADGDCVEGELAVSIETARNTAAQLGWSPLNELLLYAVHGTLHICGLEDHESIHRREMRAAERATLARLGIRDADRFSPDRFESTDGEHTTE